MYLIVDAELVKAFGNTYVTITWACLLADSRSQWVYSLTYILIRSFITEAPVLWPLSSSLPCLGPPIFFLLPPTHSCFFSTPHITIAYAHLHTLLSGRGGLIEGVHPPSLSSFTLQRSWPTIDFFCTPCRLPARIKLKSTYELHEHLQDIELFC